MHWRRSSGATHGINQSMIHEPKDRRRRQYGAAQCLDPDGFISPPLSTPSPHPVTASRPPFSGLSSVAKNRPELRDAFLISIFEWLT
jgi:hypothetical protein